MKDILLLVALVWGIFMVIDVDGSVWGRHSREREYARLLVACLNGVGFSFGTAVVLCDVTEVPK